MKMSKSLLYKLIALAVALVLAALAGVEFYTYRHTPETIVVSDALTETHMLSEWVPSLKGTFGDTPVFFFDSGVEGGTLLYLGGTHPYEPAASMSAYVMLNNIQVQTGRVIVIPQANRSATTLGMLGNAYPPYSTVETEWGSTQFKNGDRWANPLDSWPDPFTYMHYPSNLALTYQDIRNVNRCYPGRPNGSLIERVCFGIMEIIRNEDVDLAIDAHEAAVMYPVVETSVAHDRALDMAMMASMSLSADRFYMKCEASPKNLRGLSHREWGDYSDTLAVLMETPHTFTDWIVGPMTDDLQPVGTDEIVKIAAEHGLTYVDYDYEFGTPLRYRVGRHLEGAKEVLSWANDMQLMWENKDIQVTWPSYNELMEKDCGYFLENPETADPELVFEI